MATSTIEAPKGIARQLTVSTISSNIGNVSIFAYKMDNLVTVTGVFRVNTALSASENVFSIDGISTRNLISFGGQGNLSCYAFQGSNNGGNVVIRSATKVPVNLYIWVNFTFACY